MDVPFLRQVASPGGRLHSVGLHNPSRFKQGPSVKTGGPWSFGTRIAGFARLGVACAARITGYAPCATGAKKSQNGPRVSTRRDTPRTCSVAGCACFRRTCEQRRFGQFEQANKGRHVRRNACPDAPERPTNPAATLRAERPKTPARAGRLGCAD